MTHFTSSFALLVGCLATIWSGLAVADEAPIDRRAVVSRHNVRLDRPDPLSPLSVGNGEFAFTADLTGLQTFPEYHRRGIPLGTQSHWGWHTMPNPAGHELTHVLTPYRVGSRTVPYASDEGGGKGYSPAGAWLRANPHRLHLGRIAFRLVKSDGSPARIDDLEKTAQVLDLWTGCLSSRFDLEGHTVDVRTVCHPDRDVLAVRVESPLLAEGRLLVALEYPYGSSDWRGSADWSRPDSHETRARIQAAGWDDCHADRLPGFPANGKWDVRWEGLRRMP